MRAITVRAFGAPDVLRIEEVPVPEIRPGTVLVKLHAAGVNPVDTYIRAGAYGAREFPFTPGYDGAGVVVASAPAPGQKRAHAVGDRVYVARPPAGSEPGVFTGTYAEHILCDAEGVFALPESVSMSQGAGVGTPYGTAWRALFQRACARPGQTVMIHGASGGVGLAAVQIAAAAGLRVVGTAGTPEGAALVRAQGAALAVNHRQPGYLDQVRAFTGGAGPDVILEMLANVNLNHDLELVARYGTIVVIGNRGTLEFNPRLTMSKDATVQGMALLNCPRDQFASMHAAIGAGLASGVYRPIVAVEMPLSDAPRAHGRVLEPSTHGKIVLIP